MEVFQSWKNTPKKTPTSDIFFEKNDGNSEQNFLKTFPVNWVSSWVGLYICAVELEILKF